ncbi:RNase P subunit p29-like protein [Coniophora puteana RWD-64-598 SS2]|uniref:RNase P subunit p29-like protein n=1 Tax=Coniophora puteana (strain RWD-64-598) TaxID=741705 RepID=A0A5M3MXA1_CONPW|nr:RNase P subunit p29-like protein [Coniophora puteana RWD-64-598 SS2]EIW83637.1 RNase P subunit p29-like protein [Coniophora puteana RWD-64-598 SS2]
MTSNTSTVNPYQPLPPHVHSVTLSSSPFTPTYVKTALTQASDPDTLYAQRVQGRTVLLENPARESRAKKEGNARRARKVAQKKRKALGVMSSREAKGKGLWKLEKGAEKFELFVPLHHLWMGYMSELLGLAPLLPMATPSASAMPPASSMHVKLVKADMHGSILKVSQSKNPSLVGLEGVVIHETENAFKVVTPKDKLKLIPKQNTIFVLSVPLYAFLSQASSESGSADAAPTRPITIRELPHIEFQLYGNQFCFRSAERAGKKFKAKETIEL